MIDHNNQPDLPPRHGEHEWGRDGRLWRGDGGRWVPSRSSLYGPLEEGEVDPRFTPIDGGDACPRHRGGPDA